MTDFTIVLRLPGLASRVQAYQIYGEIAGALESTGLELVSITDDVASAPAEPPAPKPARKPRGPNKAKVQEPSDPPPAGDSSMPDFLKRGA